MSATPFPYKPMHEFVSSPFQWREAVAAGYVCKLQADDPNVRTKTFRKWQGSGTTSRATSRSPWAIFREANEPATEVRGPAKPKKGHAELPLGPLTERDAPRYRAAQARHGAKK